MNVGEEQTASSDANRAGASAWREHARRKAMRQERVRRAHPLLGGALLAMSDDPQSTRAWATGAVGEERVARLLDNRVCATFQTLHDRRIPRSRANIDHLVICGSGIWVVDTKRYVRQRPARRTEGGIFRPRVEKLYVGRRDRTQLVDGVLHQVEVVRSVLPGIDLPLQGVLCFIEADWPLTAGGFRVRGVEVSPPRTLARHLAKPGPVPAPEIERIRDLLAARLLPA